MANKIKRKLSVTIAGGYDCKVCGVQTVTYDGSAPVLCLNCQAPGPVRAWKDIIKHDLTVETCPPDDSCGTTALGAEQCIPSETPSQA